MEITLAVRRLSDGGTYTLDQLQRLCVREFADRVRALAGLTVTPRPRVRAPRATGVVVPMRRVRGDRIGDRLARS